MSLPCGHKSNTETVAQYRKRCGPRPLGMIGKISESEIKTIHKILTQYGRSTKDATDMIKKNYKKVVKKFRGDSPRDKAMAILGYSLLGEVSRKTQLKYFRLHRKRMELIRKYGGFGPQAGSYKLKLKILDLEKQMKQLKMNEAPRKPRKKGQHRNSPSHSDLYTDENPKGTIKGLKFATVKDAEKSVSKIKGSGKSHAHKIQAAVAMEQRAREMGKSSQAAVYRKFINKMKKKTKQRNEGWSDKYKKSIDCNNPKGFSQKAHCAGRNKQESKMSLKLEELVGKPITEAQFDEAAGEKDACYRKVKARYDVWPSAYASGALVKCRKVGAKNWGNKSKKENMNEAPDVDLGKKLQKIQKQIYALGHSYSNKANVPAMMHSFLIGLKMNLKKGKLLEKMRPQVKKLLKQKGYNPIFGAIDNSKRQLKQMRYSRGEIQDTLISMFGDEDPKILQKIKESVDEVKLNEIKMDMEKFTDKLLDALQGDTVDLSFGIKHDNKIEKMMTDIMDVDTYYQFKDKKEMIKGLKKVKSNVVKIKSLNKSIFDKVLSDIDKAYKTFETNIQKRIQISESKKESVNEKKGDFLDSLFPKSKVDKAVKIAHDMGGNMTGAVKKIEKYFKGMTLHSKVRDALQQANESVNENNMGDKLWEACWKGYEKKGMKKMFGKMYPNCVKKESYDLWTEDGSFGYTMTGLIEAEYGGRKVKLGKPMQGDVKKFKVYVKNDKGNVVKVNFGHGGSSAKGKTMRIRKSNPDARKSFRARHNCDSPGPRHKARYWSCKKW